MTLSCSPSCGEGGGLASLFCACLPATGRVLGKRRMQRLRELTGATVCT